MKCPTCGAWTEVKDSRLLKSGYTRLRLCANGHRFKTVEAPVKPKPEGAH
jgi:transcriptional regulator NrdR family protein